MKTNQKILLLGGAVVLLALGIKFFPSYCDCTAPSPAISAAGLKVETVHLGGNALSVEVADTDAAREQGLSDRTSLASGAGMLFVFDSPAVQGFWMKDMNFPLDIVWVDANKQVIGVEKNLSPSTYPNVFYSPSDVLYVLELPAGYFDAHGLKVGSPLTLF